MPDLDYKSLFETSPVSVLVLDKQLSILTASDQYLADTFTDREQITGKNIFDVFPDNPDDPHADGVAKLKASLAAVLREKTTQHMPVQKYDVRKKKKDGFEERFWSPQNIPILDEKNEVKYIIHRVEDVTELIHLRNKDNQNSLENNDLRSRNLEMETEIIKRYREIEKSNELLRQANADLIEKTTELKRSNAELSSFAATASHDIQAPFRIVGNYLNIIQEKLKAISELASVEEYFKKIYGARERISTLLNDLLQFAMVSEASEQMELVDLKEVIQDVFKNLEAQIKDSSAELKTEGNFPVVTGSRTQFLQLFQNLISNAIKFNRTAPRVEISVKKEKDNYLFSIKDNGVGIEPEYFEKIFEVFQRLNSLSEFPGTGLGLAICKRIIDRHKGKIWIESEKDKGTTFYFTLPA